MKRPLITVLCVNAAIILLAFLTFSGNAEEAFAGGGLAALLLCPVNLIVGIIVALVGTAGSRTRYYGLSMLLMSGVVLLCGIGFCSQVRINV